MTEPSTHTEYDASRQAAERSEPWWKSTWPLGRDHWLQLAGALAAVVALYVVVGLTLSDWTAPNALTELDVEVAESLAAGRTPVQNDLSHWGSFPSDTPIKIGASILLAGFMLWLWRRWHEPVFVGLTLIFEATAYIISSTIVGRPRPDVERLVESPVDTSFPSGHVAAATVYGAIAVVVFWHNRNTVVRALAVVASAALVLVVSWARLYKGMHFLSDVVAGVILGLLSIWIVYRIMGKPADAAPVLDSDHGLTDDGLTNERTWT